jgi:O-antigen ligase
LKYLVFIVGAMGFVPVVAALATQRRLRPWLLMALCFTPVLGEIININFLSMETYRGPDRGFEVNLTDLFTWGMIAGLLLKDRSKIQWLPYNTFPLLLFFFCCIVSTVVAPLKVVALFTLWKLAKLYLVYWCVVNYAGPKLAIDFHFVAYAMVGVNGFVAMLAIKQKYLEGLYRIHGPFDHSNTVPIFLIQVIPVVLLWSSCDRKVPRPLAITALLSALGGTFAIATTQSRAGTALVGLAMLGSVALASLRWPSRRTVGTSLVFLLLAGAGALKAADTMLDRVKNAPKASEEAREEFNYAAELMIKDRPWTGVGLNNFSRVLTNEAKYNSHIVIMANEEQAGVAHHIYLLTAAETGLTGLAAFLLCLFRWWGLMLYHGIRSKSYEGTYLLGYFLGFGCFLVIGFLEWAFRISPVTYFVAVNMGVVVSLTQRTRHTPTRKLKGKRLADPSVEPAKDNSASLGSG